MSRFVTRVALISLLLFLDAFVRTLFLSFFLSSLSNGPFVREHRRGCGIRRFDATNRITCTQWGGIVKIVESIFSKRLRYVFPLSSNETTREKRSHAFQKVFFTRFSNPRFAAYTKKDQTPYKKTVCVC